MLEEVGKAFGRRLALDRITLSIPEGSCLLLLGPNGAGKTTLLRVAAGLARPTAGRVLYEGSAENAPARLRPRVGYVSHQTLLYDGLTGRQNLAFFGRLYGVRSPGGRAEELVRAFGLERYADRPVAALSRGMQQRLGLARALVHGPSLLLFDEPYAGLDAAGAHLLTEILHDLKSREATLLLAAHTFDEPLQLANAVAILSAGELRHAGPVDGLSALGLAELYGRVTKEDWAAPVAGPRRGSS